jgi:hypothetical protein
LFKLDNQPDVKLLNNTMENLLSLAQLVVALSVAFVWIFRYDNVVKEFKQFGLNDLTRNLVGATKIALATLLVAGIWYPSLVQISSVLMGLFMIAAQYFHFKIKNPFSKHLPSLILLILCVIIALLSIQ